MTLEELRSQFLTTAPTIYRVEDGQVIKYKTLVYEENKKKVVSVSEIDEDNSFSVAFSKPSNWKPDYALPFISILGIDEKTEKLKLEVARKKGGWDFPGRFFWEDGDFFMSEQAARNFINE